LAAEKGAKTVNQMVDVGAAGKTTTNGKKRIVVSS